MFNIACRDPAELRAFVHAATEQLPARCRKFAPEEHAGPRYVGPAAPAPIAPYPVHRVTEPPRLSSVLRLAQSKSAAALPDPPDRSTEPHDTTPNAEDTDVQSLSPTKGHLAAPLDSSGDCARADVNGTVPEGPSPTVSSISTLLEPNVKSLDPVWSTHVASLFGHPPEDDTAAPDGTTPIHAAPVTSLERALLARPARHAQHGAVVDALLALAPQPKQAASSQHTIIISSNAIPALDQTAPLAGRSAPRHSPERATLSPTAVTAQALSVLPPTTALYCTELSRLQDILIDETPPETSIAAAPTDSGVHTVFPAAAAYLERCDPVDRTSASSRPADVPLEPAIQSHAALRTFALMDAAVADVLPRFTSHRRFIDED